MSARTCSVCFDDYGGQCVPTILTCSNGDGGCQGKQHVCFDCAENHRSEAITELTGKNKKIKCPFCKEPFHSSKDTPWIINYQCIELLKEICGVEFDTSAAEEAQKAMRKNMGVAPKPKARVRSRASLRIAQQRDLMEADDNGVNQERSLEENSNNVEGIEEEEAVSNMETMPPSIAEPAPEDEGGDFITSNAVDAGGSDIEFIGVRNGSAASHGNTSMSAAPPATNLRRSKRSRQSQVLEQLQAFSEATSNGMAEEPGGDHLEFGSDINLLVTVGGRTYSRESINNLDENESDCVMGQDESYDEEEPVNHGPPSTAQNQSRGGVHRNDSRGMGGQIVSFLSGICRSLIGNTGQEYDESTATDDLNRVRRNSVNVVPAPSFALSEGAHRGSQVHHSEEPNNHKPHSTEQNQRRGVAPRNDSRELEAQIDSFLSGRCRSSIDNTNQGNDQFTTTDDQERIRTNSVNATPPLPFTQDDNAKVWLNAMSNNNISVYRIRCYNTESVTPEDKYARKCSQWCVNNGCIITNLDLAALLPYEQRHDGDALKRKVLSVDCAELREECRGSHDFDMNEFAYVRTYRQFIEMKKGDIVVLHTKGGYAKCSPPQTLTFGVLEDDICTSMLRDEAINKIPWNFYNPKGNIVSRLGIIVRKVKWLRQGELRAVRGTAQAMWLAECQAIWLAQVGVKTPKVLEQAIRKMTSKEFLRNTYAINNEWSMG